MWWGIGKLPGLFWVSVVVLWGMDTPFQQNGACWVIRIDISHMFYCFYCADLFSRP